MVVCVHCLVVRKGVTRVTRRRGEEEVTSIHSFIHESHVLYDSPDRVGVSPVLSRGQGSPS